MDFDSRPDFNPLVTKMANPKRQQVGLSLSPEEKHALDLAASKSGHKPTSFATILYRFAFRQLQLGMSVQEMIEMAEPPPSGSSVPARHSHKKGKDD